MRLASLVAAFAGSVGVIFLDEPTSGMDVHSRRFAWNYVRKVRHCEGMVSFRFLAFALVLGSWSLRFLRYTLCSAITTSALPPILLIRRFAPRPSQMRDEGRTIILSTHFLDEADILSDRVAIMSDSRLRCVGSPMFLKNAYGVGYQLNVETNW